MIREIIKTLSLLLFILPQNGWTQEPEGQEIYKEALEILKGSNVNEYAKAFELLDEARELNHVLASGLSSAIDNTCAFIEETLPYCGFSKVIIYTHMSNSMYGLLSYQVKGEVCLITGLADSGLFIKDIYLVDIDVMEWITGDNEQQYIQASKWIEIPVHLKKHNRYRSGMNLRSAIKDLKAAKQVGNIYAEKYLQLLLQKYPMPEVKRLIESNEPVYANCLG